MHIPAHIEEDHTRDMILSWTNHKVFSPKKEKKICKEVYNETLALVQKRLNIKINHNK